MMDAGKYAPGYFPVESDYCDWVHRDHIEAPPIWCSVERPVLSMIANMLESAAQQELPFGAAPGLHSDQSWQYQHKQCREKLVDYGIIQSMSRKGNLDFLFIRSDECPTQERRSYHDD